MIRIQATAPFRYDFRGKSVWLTTGDSIYLDPTNDLHKEELKYILSSRFPNSRYIYINMAAVPENLRLEVGLEDGAYHLPNPYPLPDDCPPAIPASFMAPIKDPEENPHLNPVIGATLDDITLITESCEEDTTTEVIINSIDADSECDYQSEEDELSNRVKELNHTNWSKVKDIANTYGIEYTNKKETIESIIDMEFGTE